MKDVSKKPTLLRYADVFDSFLSGAIRHCHVGFVPAVTIGCVPPYEAGKRDSTWIATGRLLPKPTDQSGWERRLGMRLLPLPAPSVTV